MTKKEKLDILASVIIDLESAYYPDWILNMIDFAPKIAEFDEELSRILFELTSRWSREKSIEDARFDALLMTYNVLKRIEDEKEE